LLSLDVSVLIGVVVLVVVLGPASLAWAAVVALELLRALLTVVVASGSVDGASLISDLVLGHPLEGVVSITTVASIITRAGDEDLRSDVDIWPLSLSGNLDSVRHG